MVTWIHVAAVQTRVHYALTQTAMELSHYMHVLEIFNVSHLLRGVNAQASGTQEEMDGVINNAFGVLRSAETVRSGVVGLNPGAIESGLDGMQSNASGAMVETIGGWGDNPDDFLRGLLWVAGQTALQEGFSYLFGEFIVPPFFERYMRLEHPRTTSAEYFARMPVNAEVEFSWRPDSVLGALEQQGVYGLNRQGTILFRGTPYADDITISARYRLEFSQWVEMLLPLPEMQVIQEVQTRAWTGDGGYFRLHRGSGYMGDRNRLVRE